MAEEKGEGQISNGVRKSASELEKATKRDLYCEKLEERNEKIPFADYDVGNI